MKTFLAGALLGLVVGGAAVFVLMNSDDDASSDKTIAAQITPSTAASNSLATDSANSDREAIETRAPRTNVSDSSRLVVPASSQRIDASPRPTTTSQEMAASAKLESKSSNEATKPVDPIPMLPAHREMMTTIRGPDGNVLQQQHVALEQEDRDQAWSHYMEQMLGSYIDARAPQLGIEIVNITCRTTACEIQAFDKGPNRLATLLGDATRESWWDFSSMDARGSEYENRIRTIIYLGRAKKQPNEKQKLTPLART